MSAADKAQWFTADFDPEKSTNLRLTVVGPWNQHHEFMSRFVREEYGEQSVSLSVDRLDTTADLEIVSIGSIESIDDAIPMARVTIDARAHGRPSLEALLETSRRLPGFSFVVMLEHAMLEGEISIADGVVGEESFIDWTERDEDLSWIPGQAEPWKPR